MLNLAKPARRGRRPGRRRALAIVGSGRYDGLADPQCRWHHARGLEHDVTRTALSIVRIVVGVLLVVLGIVGLFLPLLQGILFIVLGLGLLSVDVPVVRRWRDRLKHWHRERRARRRAAAGCVDCTRDEDAT